MVNKPRGKSSKDASQDKRIAKLERQFPTVNEVVNSAASLQYDDTTQGHVYSLLPASLNDEKVEFRGFSLRTLSTNSSTDKSVCRYRVLMLLYKCTADYTSAGSPTFTQPVINDILNDNGDKTLANYNPDNTNRVRMIHDRVYSGQGDITNIARTVSRKYKRSISFMPLVDKAFVMRPFLIVVSADTSSTNKITVAYDCDLHTRQAP